jgi:hypothetical protein
MRYDLRDRAAEILAHPRFLQALLTYRVAVRENYRRRPTLYRYVSEARRYFVNSLAFHLHITRDRSDDSDGLTFQRLRALCTSAGLASPGMVHLYLQTLRANGFLVVVDTGDRRFRRLEPTEKMINHVRDHSRAHLAPVDVLFPELNAVAQVDADVEFVFALRRATGRAFFEKGNPIFGHPEVNYFAKKVSGHMVLLELIEAVTGPDLMPQSRATKVDLVALGEHCGVSRVHVTKIIAGAATGGLVIVEGPGGSAIRPTDLLIQKFLEWAAMQFAFFTDSAIDAMKERAASRKPARVGEAPPPTPIKLVR